VPAPHPTTWLLPQTVEIEHATNASKVKTRFALGQIKHAIMSLSIEAADVK